MPDLQLQSNSPAPGQAAPGGQPERPPPTTQQIETALPEPFDAKTTQPEPLGQPFQTSDEPYIFPSGLSEPSAWARDSYRVQQMRNYRGAAPGPFAPRLEEVRDITHRVASYFAANGSRPQQLRAARMFAYSDKYWKDLLQGKLLLAQIDHEQKVAEEAQFLADNRRYFSQLADVFQIYQNEPSLLRQKLSDLARRHQDDNMLHAAQTQSIEDIKKDIGNRANNNEALLHIAAQRANVEKLEREQAHEAAIDSYLNPQSAPAADPVAPARTTTSGATPATPSIAPNVPNVSPQLMQDAQQFQMSDRTSAHLPATVVRFKDDKVTAALTGQTQALDNYLNWLVEDPNSGRGTTKDEREKELLPLIRAKNPYMANKIENFLSGRETPTASAADKPGDSLALRLAGKIDPDFQRLSAVKKLQQDRDVQRERLRIGRPELVRLEENIDGIRSVIKRNIDDMDRLVTMANDLGGTLRPIVDRRLRWLRREIAGDPQISAFDTQITEIQRDAGQILTAFNAAGRGQYTVYAQRSMKDLIDNGANAAQIKAQADILKWDYERQLLPMVEVYNSTSDRFFEGKGPHMDIGDILEKLRSGRAPLPPMPTYREIH